MIFVLTLILGFVASDAYPVTYTSCGVNREVTKIPERIVTLNQGATELMLALGLADKMVGTAYLDDYIWPKYATEYAKIKVLASSYPTEKQIMDVNPDFIVASYNSAFRAQYDDNGKTKGIFSEAQVGKCEGAGSVWAGSTAKATCRPQLHAKGISTFLFADACEDTSLRPRTVSEATVYSELRALGAVFKVDVEAIIKEMKGDFDAAAAMVSTSGHGSKLKAVWLDCVKCCNNKKKAAGEEMELFVGANSGAPGLLMREAGLTNAFAAKDGNWVCVKVSEVIATNPDVMIVADASWDTALSKITWLYNHTGFCGMDLLKGARFIQIPFSATTLGPRNGPAALDLAIASLHVRLGAVTATRKSGVGSFDPPKFKSHINGLKCTLVKDKVKYEMLTDSSTAGTTGSTSSEQTSGSAQRIAAFSMLVLSWFVAMLSVP